MPGTLSGAGSGSPDAGAQDRNVLGRSAAGVHREPRTTKYWIAETRRRLEETVRMRLMSDVPLGMFLSGGVDSSAIAALIKRSTSRAGEDVRGGISRKQQFSELSYAAQVAQSIGTEHHEVVVGMDDFFAALPQLIWHEDEPIAWPSSVSLYFVSKLAAKQVKVVLTGEGSDELFGGYERYRWNLLNQRYAAAVSACAPGLCARWIRAQVASSAAVERGAAAEAAATRSSGAMRDLESLFLDNFYCAFSERGTESAACCFAAGDSTGITCATGMRGRAPLRWRACSIADQKTYLVELLMKQDQMSMACSIESRVPFLDHHFRGIRGAYSGPAEDPWRRSKSTFSRRRWRICCRTRSSIARRWDSPRRCAHWLMDPRAEAALCSASARRDGLLATLLDMQEVSALIERHRAGLEDATDRIWRLLNLQLWGDLFLTGRKDGVDSLRSCVAAAYEDSVGEIGLFCIRPRKAGRSGRWRR